MGVPRSIGDGYACDCGVTSGDHCKQGIDCRAVRLTKAIRQLQSAAARAAQPVRDEATRGYEAHHHRIAHASLYDRLAVLGIDPHELKTFLDTLPARG